MAWTVEGSIGPTVWRKLSRRKRRRRRTSSYAEVNRKLEKHAQLNEWWSFSRTVLRLYFHDVFRSKYETVCVWSTDCGCSRNTWSLWKEIRWLRGWIRSPTQTFGLRILAWDQVETDRLEKSPSRFHLKPVYCYTVNNIGSFILYVIWHVALKRIISFWKSNLYL